ncbi:two-component system chemotaxis sensor kinase CheA [Brevundimonas bullata]|uniref:Chemotaxis protein CheA n=1 Tax=Brevundimonas bullata TaxID=13160 RepID=A0A7W7N2L7_9CAUL|nr:hybrid sensor histidine kinase/response regulator [Brevundimonas bullata]MBB4796399.1 two-component system chemotaxis sensor kinase CheA [Brevundimonas bullata]MBB6381359.1 two-component system chemotaxis sensor kinase CheA [Brevundimonas bullata]
MDDVINEFIAEAREGIEAVDAKLVRFEQTPDDPDLLGDIFRLIHSLKGGSGFLGLMRLQSVTHAAENVLGLYRDGTLAVDAASVTVILDAVDVVRAVIEGLAETGVEPEGDDRALIGRLDRIYAGDSAPAATASAASRSLLERVGGDATLDAACEGALALLVTVPVTGPLFAGIDLDRVQAEWREALCGVARATAAPGAFQRALAETFGEALAGHEAAFVQAVRQNLIDLEGEAEAVDTLLAAPPAEREAEPARADRSEPAKGPQTIRVGVDTLEGLMTMVSELVLIRNQLIQTLRAQPETPFAGPLHRLNQVTSELQEGVMTTRMQPISGAWAKLPRLVRDLASDLGKRIDLVMTGEDTELDRQVMELIRDPLTHMIRNAADHGLETPEQRRAAGKPETGRITLLARHEGGAILIEMADDGRGLPAARIRDKAVEAGLISPAQAAAMSDAEARQMIFLPGFSTAASVTAVSGRGVGMDVVRTNIEAIGGAIELASVEGQGTRFSIRIPLTLSIIAGLVVECCGERFAMPQASIIELVSANGAAGRRIEQINGAEVLRLRDRLLPLVSLQALLGLEAPEGPRGEACIVVARVGAFTFGVIVDRVFDTEEIVVKPVATILRHLKLYSGATILGDGAVIMILDFKGMAVEAGAGALLNGGDDMAAETAVSDDRTESLLVFRAADGGLKAAPLAGVARIEELEPAALEWADGRSLLQYRGQLMPVLNADGAPLTSAPPTKRPLLVFSRGERSLGLMAEEIVDIVEAAATAELAGSSTGVSGSVVVAGRATELIDVDFYWRRCDGVAEPRLDAPPVETQSVGAFVRASKRLLVVDESPFTRMLLGPLLAQAGYEVEVAGDAEAALAMHDAGVAFDLILADTSHAGPAARRLASAFGRASAWHATPLLGLGTRRMAGGDPADDGLLADVAEALSDTPSSHDDQEAA